MKKKSFFIISAIVSIMCSCSSLTITPKLYDEEIHDAVKFRIAWANYLILLTQTELYDDDDTDVIWTEIDKRKTTYQQILKSLSKDTNFKFPEDAKIILNIYSDLNISLSEYSSVVKSDKRKSWQFKELHSDIEFLFEVENLDSDERTWSCTPLEKSLEDYWNRKIEE